MKTGIWTGNMQAEGCPMDFRMWGWTPHNYCQPQFANWKDVRWHRTLTDRFLNG